MRQPAVAVERPEHHPPGPDRLQLHQHVVHERRHGEPALRGARGGQEVVHPQRDADQPGGFLPARAAAERGDVHDVPDAMARDRLAGRPGELDIGRLQVLRARIGRHDPEQGVRAVERLVQHRRVAVRALHDLRPRPHLRRQAVRVARDDADGLAGIEQHPGEPVADLAGGRGDDDHLGSSSERSCRAKAEREAARADRLPKSSGGLGIARERQDRTRTTGSPWRCRKIGGARCGLSFRQGRRRDGGWPTRSAHAGCRS